MSEMGKEVRLGRIFNRESNNTVMVAMDHGVPIGPVPGIIKPGETVASLCKVRPDTFFMPAGLLKQVYPSFIEYDIPFIAAIDTCTMLGPEPDYFMLADTVEHAMSMGASAVSMHVLVGPKKTSDMLKGLAKIAIDCDHMGMPLMAIMYPSGFENNFDVRVVKWVARIAAELGADIVKTYYTGCKETYAEVIESCPLPVLLSGGKIKDDPRDFLAPLKDCIDCGARGTAVGRNVWQSKNPPAILKAVRRLVHDNCSVDEALA